MPDILRLQIERTYFALEERELEELRNTSTAPWKDYTLVLAPFSIALLLNAAKDFMAQTTGQQLTLMLFLNGVIGIASLLASLGFGLMWWHTTKKGSLLLENIRDKPKLLLAMSTNQPAFNASAYKRVAQITAFREDLSFDQGEPTRTVDAPLG